MLLRLQRLNKKRLCKIFSRLNASTFVFCLTADIQAVHPLIMYQIKFMVDSFTATGPPIGVTMPGALGCLTHQNLRKFIIANVKTSVLVGQNLLTLIC